jgi:hypothetical protein
MAGAAGDLGCSREFDSTSSFAFAGVMGFPFFSVDHARNVALPHRVNPCAGNGKFINASCWCALRKTPHFFQLHQTLLAQCNGQ